jgi:extradiol dioxygenase family protein
MQGYDVLTVRKVKHLYYYFINGKYISKELINSFYGPAIGFEAGRNTTMWVDYLKVSRLTL